VASSVKRVRKKIDINNFKLKQGIEIRLSNQYNERNIYKTNKNKS